MASYFRESRNIELSLLYYLETNLGADWSGVTVEKSFKKVYAKDVSLPIVCCSLIDTASTRQEVGSTTLDNRYLLRIDIFATSDAQRLDLADYIKDKIKDGWVHYDHSHTVGDKTSLELSPNGRDYVTNFITDAKIEFGDSSDVKDNHRHNITVRVRKSS